MHLNNTGRGTPPSPEWEGGVKRGLWEVAPCFSFYKEVNSSQIRSHVLEKTGLNQEVF